MQLTRALLWLVAGLVIAGCGGDLGPATTCAPPACTSASSYYAVEVVSASAPSDPAAGALPDDDFGDVMLDTQSDSFAVKLPATAQLSGHIFAGSLAVPGSITFTRPSHVLGRPNVYYETTADASGAYSLAVPVSVDGEMYSVRVQPNDGASYPPLQSSMSLSGDQTLDFTVPSGDSIVTLHGTLADALGDGVVDATVTLLDATTLDAISTTAQTDGGGGFYLHMPAEVLATSDLLQLAVADGDPSTGLLSISLTLSADSLERQLDDQLALPIMLPTLPSASHIQLVVMGTGSNGAAQPVPNANVQLLTNLEESSSAIVAQHEVETQTDANGQLSVDLYTNAAGARIYAVNISPSAGSPFQSTSTTVTVGSASGVTANILLGARPQVTGRVVDPNGAPVTGAVLQPQLTTVGQPANIATSSLATTPQLPTTTSDQDGRFSLYLDPGVYDVSVVPPATASVARLWLPARNIQGDVDLGTLSTPTAIAFEGGVVDHAGAPVEATLRLYSVPGGNLGCNPNDVDCLQTPLLVAEGSTDAQGQTPLLLPSAAP